MRSLPRITRDADDRERAASQANLASERPKDDAQKGGEKSNTGVARLLQAVAAVQAASFGAAGRGRSWSASWGGHGEGGESQGGKELELHVAEL